jgi:hypothetical protein
MPNDANDPRDGIGFIAAAPTQEEAIEKLKLQFKDNYSDPLDRVEYHIESFGVLSYFVAHWKSNDDGVESAEIYWLHTAEG